ncbi:MAG: putative zinc-binding metallopeptidase [Capnocytophaga sp.]|nr:putative zinc-binding metallopeptidase [Capnocytophaga sp.]
MKKIFILIITAFVFITCNKKETLSEESVIKERKVARTAIDDYIYENFQKPYNIMVIYNWQEADFEMKKYLYPPQESKIQPALEIIKKIWIDAYVSVAGEEFMKKVTPRQISIAGGYNVNEDGSVTLGFADSGNKITLFEVNYLDVANHERTKLFFHTIQHEYCHIINQKKPYSTEYRKITPEGYTAAWHNVPEKDALAKGFITPYSMKDDIEDFAEMTSSMLDMTKAQWDAKINAITNTTAKEAIRKKEAFVVNYFKSEWNIDFYKLQEIVNERVNSVLQ